MLIVKGAFTELLRPGLAEAYWTEDERQYRLMKGERCKSCGAPPTKEFPICGYCGSDWGWKYVPHNYPPPE